MRVKPWQTVGENGRTLARFQNAISSSRFAAQSARISDRMKSATLVLLPSAVTRIALNWIFDPTSEQFVPLVGPEASYAMSACA